MRGFPSGPEATLLHQKAGYMYATFIWMQVKLFPCNAGRTIYDPFSFFDPVNSPSVMVRSCGPIDRIGGQQPDSKQQTQKGQSGKCMNGPILDTF